MLYYSVSVIKSLTSTEHSLLILIKKGTLLKKSFPSITCSATNVTWISLVLNLSFRAEIINLKAWSMAQHIFLFVLAFILSLFYLYHESFNVSAINYWISSKFKHIHLKSCHSGNDTDLHIGGVCFEFLPIIQLLWLKFSRANVRMEPRLGQDLRLQIPFCMIFDIDFTKITQITGSFNAVSQGFLFICVS
jgi:hypothetical protein